MKHGGFEMSKFLFCYCIQINFVYIRFIFDEGEYVTQFVNTWCLLYKPGKCVLTFYDYDTFNFFVVLYSQMIGTVRLC
jgi:hypothetical protein